MFRKEPPAASSIASRDALRGHKVTLAGEVLSALGAFDRRARFLFALGILAACTPIWVPRYLPLFDLPNHLAAAFVWGHLHAPGLRLSDYYRIHLIPAPYWGYYFPLVILSQVLPIEIASKLFLTAYVVGVPVTVAALARRLGRDPRVALLSIPFVFNYCLKWGWVSFLGGIPILFIAFLALLAYLEEPSWRRGLTLAVLALCTYFMHPLPWIILGAWSLVALVVSLRRPLVALRAGLLLLPSLLVAYVNLKLPKPVDVQSTFYRGSRFLAVWEDYRRSVAFLPMRFTVMADASIEKYTALAIAGGFLTLWVASVIGKSSAGSKARWKEILMPWLLVTALFGLYFALPIHIKQPVRWWGVNFRVIPVIGMCGALLIRGKLDGWRQVVIAGILVAFSVNAAWLTREFLVFNQRAEGFNELMKNVPRGSSVIYFCLERSDERSFYMAEAFSEMNSMAQIRVGGYNPFQFEMGFPIVAKKDRRPPVPGWSTMAEAFNPTVHERYFDFVLTYAEPKDGSIYRAGGGPERRPISASGRWRLYAGNRQQ